jgi:hypothetical protein
MDATHLDVQEENHHNSQKGSPLVSIQYNPIIQVFYHRLKDKEKNGKVVVCAVMWKLVHLIFGILKSGKPFEPNYRLYSA